VTDEAIILTVQDLNWLFSDTPKGAMTSA